jgi:PAS domain S-box-containing protein
MMPMQTKDDIARTQVFAVSKDTPMLQAIREAIASFGVELVDESSFSASLDQLRARSYSLILVDTDGSPEDALDLLRFARASYPEEALFAIGSNPSTELLIGLIRSGVDDFSQKPVDEHKLAAKIRTVCQKKMLSDVHSEVLERLKNTGGAHDEVRGELPREVIRANEELRLLNQSLRKNVSQLTILYQMGRDISENENWSDALDRILMALVNYLQAEGAALLLFSGGQRRLSPRANFQIDTQTLTKISARLLERWRDHPRGSEIHSMESYEGRVYNTCLESLKPWRFTVVPLRHRNRALGFITIDKRYSSGQSYRIDYHFLNTIQTILTGEVANAAYISELRQLSRLNQKVLDNINSGVITTDLSGRIRFFNQHALSICPYLKKRRDLHFNDVFRDPSAGEGIYEAMIGSDRDTHVREVDYIREKDRVSPARLSMTKMHDDNLNGTVLVAIFEDLTEQRRYETEIRRNDRLRVLGQMSAGVAHEIRNPLTGIATSAEVLASKVRGENEKTKYIRAILDEINRLDGIIKRASVGAGSPKGRGTNGDE